MLLCASCPDPEQLGESMWPVFESHVEWLTPEGWRLAMARQQNWSRVEDLFLAGPQELRLAHAWRSRLALACHATKEHVEKLMAQFPAPHLVSRPLWNMDATVNSLFATANELSEFLQSPESGLRQFFEANPWDEVFFAITASVDERISFGSRLQGEIILRDERQETVTFREHQVLEPHRSMAETVAALKLAGLRFIISAAMHHVIKEKLHRKELADTRVVLAAKHKALSLQLQSLHSLVGETKESQAKLEELGQLLAELDHDLQEVDHTLGNPEDMLREVDGMLRRPEQFLNVHPARLRLTKEGIKLPLEQQHDGWCIDYSELFSEEGRQPRAMVLATALRHEVLGLRGKRGA